MRGRSFFIVGFLLVSAFAQAQNIRPLIVGGQEAAPGEFPSMVSLQQGSWGHFCGGSLIRKNWVLTAAHCVSSSSFATRTKIVVGLHEQGDTTGAETFTVKKVMVHPQYGDKTGSDFDFALVQLSGDSRFAPVALNETELDIPDDESEAPMSVTAGWGAMKEGGSVASVLMKVEVPLVSAKRCDQAYTGEVTDSMICAGLENGGKDSCQGDSGGPLFVRSESGENLLAGVVSWGEGCARPNKFGVYSKVNAAAAWIYTQLN